MTELLPSLQSAQTQAGISDFLTTTFSLADRSVQQALDAFLSDPVNGIFKGPYVRLRTPFKTADGGASPLDLVPLHPPYGHQAAAFARLSTRDLEPEERPAPTLVTTGTGSGKTESFLYPILDHVLRHKRRGGAGISAIILYPMNALAIDQAHRLASMITGSPELGGVRAALYVGDGGDDQRSIVTADGLINDRDAIRADPPDILLTNYKMLDRLLLRSADQDLWRKSALSLQYLVLDEFHTYDGAQGTDVAMLLRRLGLALKAYWPSSHKSLTAEHRARPLGRITPVATSATLGDEGESTSLLEFAERIFGEVFTSETVVTETRLTPAEWAASAPAYTLGTASTLDRIPVADALKWIDAGLDSETQARRAAATLFVPSPGGTPEVEAWEQIPTEDLDGLAAALRAHPGITRIAQAAARSVALRELSEQLFPRTDFEIARRYVEHLLAALSLLRARTGREFLSSDVHLWVRELTRVDRVASSKPEFRWTDDGAPIVGEATGWSDNEVRPVFPAVFCRNCGRSGWGISLASTGTGLAAPERDRDIRRDHASRTGAFRALLTADGEADQLHSSGQLHESLRAFHTTERMIVSADPYFTTGTKTAEQERALAAGEVLPVLVQSDSEAAKKDTCPACGERDAIRFLGSAIATLLSVSLSTQFGAADLDDREKKALVFTDSVQDAAHRAGFVESRSHVLTLRNAIARAIPDAGVTLGSLAAQILDSAGDDPSQRFRLIAPEMVDDRFAPAQEWWKKPEKPQTKGRALVERRLRFDTLLEFGLQSRYGRTLEMTGTAVAEVVLPESKELTALARKVFDASISSSGYLGEAPSDAELDAWIRGLLEHLRTQGGIHHEWLASYAKQAGNRYRIWGGRRRDQGMPAFPAGRSAPTFAARKLKGNDNVDHLDSPQGWYARYTHQVLGVTPAHGAGLAGLIMSALEEHGTVRVVTTESGGVLYGLEPAQVRVQRVRAGDERLVCQLCRTEFAAGPRTLRDLTGAPCLLVSCAGHLERAALGESFYRRLYTQSAMRRILAREHSGILDAVDRKRYEDGFKAGSASPESPNVLVATPTLEMGIDIGDLSTVFLASLPRTVASYVQRVGRAGRLTGNALNLTFVTGRGAQLPKLGDPLSVINGHVRPPATFLDAVEMIKRQYIASIIDRLARGEALPQPRLAAGVFAATFESSAFLSRIVTENSDHHEALLQKFLDTFGEHIHVAAAELRSWATPASNGTSGLSETLWAAHRAYRADVEALAHRRDEIQNSLAALQQAADSQAGSDDAERELRLATSAYKATIAALREATQAEWINALEVRQLLPNYTLLDDRVELDVALRWYDEDSGNWLNDRVSYDRAAAIALRDYAPGSTYYGRGLQVTVDALDLGPGGQARYELTFCPECGYSHDSRHDGQRSAACPRCHATGLADVGQRVQAVQLKRVTAAVNRDEARINDSDDERKRRTYTIVSTADINPEGIHDRWFVDGYDFGVSYLTDVLITSTNLGVKSQGTGVVITGAQCPAPLFRVCQSCGQLDSTVGSNNRRDHRPWCHERSTVNEPTIGVALTHRLRTQGALLRLPAGLLEGESSALPSLEASLRLGLREELGGDPDHIDLIACREPLAEGGTAEGLLLHDTVPGGTGYLAELSRPETVWDLLHRAYEIVRDCPCQHEHRAACQRCLLPYISMQNEGLLSRATAESRLQEILLADRGEILVDGHVPVGMRWETTTQAPPARNPESYLERRFRAVLIKRLQQIGMHLVEEPGPRGTRLRISKPGAPVSWSLDPQVDLDGVRPDFLLRCDHSGVPDLAIFADGRTFHATKFANRIADDAAKRQSIRDTGTVSVLALTSSDVDVAESRLGTVSSPLLPSWHSPALVTQMFNPAGFITWNETSTELMGNPLDRLATWIDRVSTDPHGTLATATSLSDYVPLFFFTEGVAVTLDGKVPVEQQLLDHLLGESTLTPDTEAGGPLRLIQRGPLTLLLSVDALPGGIPLPHLTMVLDDRDECLEDDDFADGWREWLHLSNMMAHRSPGLRTTITSVHLLQDSAPSKSAVDTHVEKMLQELPAGWSALLDDAVGLEKDLLASLASDPSVPVPVLGEESDEGYPMDIAWPDRRITILVAEDLDDERKPQLEAEGWTVFLALDETTDMTPVAAAIAAATSEEQQ